MPRTRSWSCLASLLALLIGGSATAQWCEEDVVSAVVHGGTIIVLHENAEWNCCTGIAFDLVQDDHVLDLYESEAGPFCWCICCFDLTATIEGVAPGTYLIRVLDAASGAVLGETTATVTDGDAAKAVLADSATSPCGGWPSAVPGDGEDASPPTWGAIKAIYR